MINDNKKIICCFSSRCHTNNTKNKDLHQKIDASEAKAETAEFDEAEIKMVISELSTKFLE